MDGDGRHYKETSEMAKEIWQCNVCGTHCMFSCDAGQFVDGPVACPVGPTRDCAIWTPLGDPTQAADNQGVPVAEFDMPTQVMESLDRQRTSIEAISERISLADAAITAAYDGDANRMDLIEKYILRYIPDDGGSCDQHVPPAESDAHAREPECGIVGPEQQADIIASPRVREEEAESNSHKSPI